MDGLVIKKLWRCAATISSQETRLCSLVSSICAARHSSHQHKKGAGFALTRLATLRHNNWVRECVHGEKVLAQPMTSE
jgi:hypothetical protein